MTTLITFLVFTGFFFFYNTSKKAVLSRSFFPGTWAQDHIQASKGLGLILLSISVILCWLYMGISSGLFAFFVILMTVGSCVVLFAPLQYVKPWVLSFVFLFALLLDLIWK